MMVIIHNLKDPNDKLGRTYKELNIAKKHKYKVGDLVECTSSGIRAFVVKCNRDCDGTPLYVLCLDGNDTHQIQDGFLNRNWAGGYSDNYLVFVNKPKGTE